MDLRRLVAVEHRQAVAHDVFHLIEQEERVPAATEHPARQFQLHQPVMARGFEPLAVPFSNGSQPGVQCGCQDFREFGLTRAGPAIKQDIDALRPGCQRLAEQGPHEFAIPAEAFEILPFGFRRGRRRKHDPDQVLEIVHLDRQRSTQALADHVGKAGLETAALLLQQAGSGQAGLQLESLADFRLLRFAKERQQARKADFPCVQRLIDDGLEAFENPVQRHEQEDADFQRRKAEMLPEPGGILVNDPFLVGQFSTDEVDGNLADLPPPGIRLPVSRPVGAFNIGQDFDQTRQFAGELAGRTAAVGQPRDKFKRMVLIEGHVLLSVLRRS